MNKYDELAEDMKKTLTKIKLLVKMLKQELDENTQNEMELFINTFMNLSLKLDNKKLIQTLAFTDLVLRNVYVSNVVKEFKENKNKEKIILDLMDTLQI